MPRVHPMQTNFTAGELSPDMEGRLDFAKYANAVVEMKNFVVNPQGGASRRGGLHLVDSCKYSDKKARLIPFKISETEAYMLEFGNAYIRFYMDGYQVKTTTGSELGIGWGTNSVVVNGDMELDSDWASVGTPEANERTDLSKYDGTYSRWHADTTPSFGGIKQDITLAINTHYRLESRVICQGGTTKICVTDSVAGDLASTTITPGVVGEWQFVTLEFDTPGTLGTTSVQFKNNSGTETNAGYVDHVSIVPRWYDKSVAPGKIAFDPGATKFAYGKMAITGESAGIGWGELRLTTTVGKEYCVYFDLIDNNCGVRIGTTSGGTEVMSEQTVEPGTYRQVVFTAESTISYLQFRVYGPSPTTAKIERVQCKEWIPLELVSPYLESDLPYINYKTSSDTMFLIHPDYDPRMLLHSSDTGWTLALADFINGPYMDEQTTPVITPSATTGTVTLTAASLVVNGAFPTDLSDWHDRSEGTGTFTYNGTDDRARLKGGTSGIGWMEQDLPTDVGRRYVIEFDSILGPINVRLGTTSKAADLMVETEFPEDTDQYFSFIATSETTWLQFLNRQDATVDIDNVKCSVFHPDHIGTIWALKHATTWGWGKITNVTSATTATLVTEVDFGAITGAVAWKEGAFSGFRGFPQAITFFEDRLILAGTYDQPQAIWGSKTGKYWNFTAGATANDSFAYVLTSDQPNLIQWVAQTRVLLVGTVGAEFKMQGSSDEPLSPSNADVKAESSYGSSYVAPIRIAHAVLFVQSAGRKIRELVYSWESDMYLAPDLTVLADALTEHGIEYMDYQQEPTPIVWVVTGDSKLLGLTYERSQQVVGWHHHETDGDVESCAVIPNPVLKQDELWVIVKRNINGTDQRFIEYIDPYINVDSGLTYDGPAVSKVYGMTHLIGETVKVVGNDAVYPDAVVASDGSVTLDGPDAETIQIGLGYTSKIRSLRPEFQVGGTSQGSPKHWVEIYVRLLNTVGISINGELIPFRHADDYMDEGVALFTGDKRVSNLGWDKEARITVEQTQPLPATVLCIFGTVDIGD